MSERKKTNKPIKKTEEEIEDILTESVKEEISNGEVNVEDVRKKLIELATAGKTQEASEEFTSKYFKKASKADLLHANSIYESYVVKRMQKSIGSCLVPTYSNIIGRFIDVDDQDSLNSNLNDDPFLEQALDNLSLRLYEKYGYLFAPASVALITSKHYRNINGEKNNGDSQGGNHAKGGESLEKTKDPGRQAAGKKLSEWNRKRKEDASLINKQIEEQEMKYMKNNSYLMPGFVGFGTLIGILYYVRRQVRADSQIVASDEIKPNNEVIKNNIFEL